MTTESDDEVFVLKFAPRLGFQLSNLKDIIDEHFNLPHVQVRCGKNGGVVLTGLFDGIPDDVESQDHESFDEINKLLGWIEGCIELPERSKSVAPKLFDESLRAMEESSDQHVHDEFEVTLANSDQISPKEVPLDEIPTCDVTNDDDMLIDEGLNVDNAVKGDEEIVQIELIDELILMKEFSDLVAHQVFDEMPRVMASHEINFDGPKLSGVASLGAVVNQPNCLHSKFDHDKVYPKLHKSVLETYVNSVACLELHYFDPGGKGFRLSGSLISNESELVDELVDDEYDHKAMHVGSVSDQDDLKVFDMNDIKDAKPLLLAKSELTGLFKKPNKLTTQGRMMNGPVESLIFDPGGVKVACAHCVAQVLIGICAYFCFHFGVDSNGDQAETDLLDELQMKNGHIRALCFDPGRGSLKLVGDSLDLRCCDKELTGEIYLCEVCLSSSGTDVNQSTLHAPKSDQAKVGILLFDPGGEALVLDGCSQDLGTVLPRKSAWKSAHVELSVNIDLLQAYWSGDGVYQTYFLALIPHKVKGTVASLFRQFKSFVIFAFDPGGQLLLLVVSRFLADMGEVYLCAHVVCNDFIESIISWQLMLVHHFREAAMLHNRGSYVLKLFEQIPSSKESMASLIKLKGRAWNASSASKTESKFFLSWS